MQKGSLLISKICPLLRKTSDREKPEPFSLCGSADRVKAVSILELLQELENGNCGSNVEGF